MFGILSYFGQYTFTSTTGTYSNLVSPISLTNGSTWDDPQYTIPLGFNFDYFDSTVNKMYIEDYGLGGFIAINPTEVGIIPTLIPYGADIMDRGYDFASGGSSTGGLSPISYKLTGIAGNRILKIEWKNVGFYSDIDDNGISTDFTNFQLWLYETSNNIEIHFGPNSITQPSLCYDGVSGTSVELVPETNYSTGDYGPNAITLNGPPLNPNVKIINSYDSLEFINGTIYKFTKTGSTASLNENVLSFKPTVYPNPANNFINISTNEKFELSQVHLMDMNGKIVRTINNQFNKVDVSDLESGIYILNIISKNGLISNSKFIKN